MEQYRVKKRFTDRNTGETHQRGDLIRVTDERAQELQEAGHLPATPVKESDAPAEPEPEA
ncbi:hypothetical protein [Deinococcus aquatilis]|uniref:hypothetical protein n=1 Tax=Deinococcus aquatilis TaxID=519440 RepID=UPI000382A3DE|nr:hypothetical protein [Deinococcus aquatilis]